MYAGLIYWFQGALDGLEYTRDMVEELVASHGKIQLDLLVAVSLVSLFTYFSLPLLASLMFWLFTVMIAVDVLRFVAIRGDITTHFSTKFMPAHYGASRKFLRNLRNAGLFGWFMPALLLSVTVAYPLSVTWAEGFQWQLSQQGFVVFLLGTAAFSLLQVRSLLVEAVGARKEIGKLKASE